jgi:uncharacterized protein YyaL (SSP411 family)
LKIALSLVAAALLACPPRSTAAVEPSPSPAPQKHENRLAKESSPYLLLHARNPVDWYPWGEEAFDKAKREGKPIFLSIGYSSCYWCHVMEREDFSNEKIARLMNESFVSIKVDREERPEVDEVYIVATQLVTGSAGWPNNLFLTPELAPFYAGTYFPPEDRPGRPGLPRVLLAMADAWKTKRSEVVAEGTRVTEALRRALAEEKRPAERVPGKEAADRVVAELKGSYDAGHGGFGGAPKFPSPANLFLLWERAAAGDGEAKTMVVGTLRKMGRGALYDQLDGGFHRYTLDAAWRVPHFEKMLYDNASLGELLAEAGAAAHDGELLALARGTFDFVLREMRRPEGGFASSLDAETDGVEGAYYAWTKEELRAVLGKDGFALLAPILGFDGAPQLDGERYTLAMAKPEEARAKAKAIEPLLTKLRETRARRKRPALDDKVLADWNGMMIAALARGGRLLGEPRYTAAARAAAEFVLSHHRDASGTLLHSWRNGPAKAPALLDDYAFLARGLLALHEATRETAWLTKAVGLVAETEKRLGDPRGGWFQSAARSDLLVRVKPMTDGAIRSGSAVAVLDLLELARKTGNTAYRDRADAALRAAAPEVERLPGALRTFAMAIDLRRR